MHRPVTPADHMVSFRKDGFMCWWLSPEMATRSYGIPKFYFFLLCKFCGLNVSLFISDLTYILETPWRNTLSLFCLLYLRGSFPPQATPPMGIYGDARGKIRSAVDKFVSLRPSLECSRALCSEVGTCSASQGKGGLCCKAVGIWCSVSGLLPLPSFCFPVRLSMRSPNNPLLWLCDGSSNEPEDVLGPVCS